MRIPHITILITAVCIWLKGQDPQYAQYYAAPLLLNPAMAGTGDCYRTGCIGRSQWTGLPGGAFNTAAAFLDLNIEDYRSGIGIQLLHDNIGTPAMYTNQLDVFYSFLIPASPQFNLRLGIQASMVSRGLDYSRLVFEDQFTGITVTQARTNDAMYNRRHANYGDISSGFLIYGDDSYWIGGTARHLFTPNEAFYTQSKLPQYFNLHGGFNIYLHNQPTGKQRPQTKLTPTFLYKTQLKFDQLDLGAYLIRNKMLCGLWYRGIPIKKDESFYNKDAISIQLGYYIKEFSLIYSYDITTSKLNIRNTWGSHEVSIIYQFCGSWPKKKKPPLHVRRLPCPDFDRSVKYQQNYLGF